ncbi:tetratricopeptide repeat protein [uncultured Kordia sp.]|uniref:tetratricopeptide repeat-containing sensor histidine kinase n=1 Tax=uncultured Kordia sp. TaxID=507699 RepID=UPI0026124D27|nr:tetratricopeptide repeat protein [uncultured Kordia sp.]
MNVLCANTAYNDTELDSLLIKAKTLEVAKKYEAAISAYEEALVIASNLNLDENTSFIYNKIGVIYYKKKEYTVATKYFKQSILNDSTSVYAADANFNLALLYRKKKDNSALTYLNRSVLMYEAEADSYKKFKTFSKAGILYKNHHDYTNAMKYLIQAYKGFTILNKPQDKAGVARTIAIIQRTLGRFDIAEMYYKEALRLWIKVGNRKKVSDGHNSLANIYSEQLKSDSAIFHYKKAIALRTDLGVQKHLGRIVHNLGAVYYMDDIQRAKKSYAEALRLKKTTKDSVSLPVTYNELAMIAVEEKQYTKATAYLDSAFVYIKENKIKDNLRFYEIKSNYYEAINQPENALIFQKKYQKLVNDLFQIERDEIIQQYQEQLQVYQKDQKIDELIINTSSLEEMIENQKKSILYKNIMLLLLGFLLIISLGVYFYYRQQQKINLQQQKLEKLAATYQGQESIKESISKDLHDIITTSYDGIRLKILALSKAKEYDKISTSIINEIKDVNQQIRLISHRLSPLRSKIKEATLTEIIVSQLSEFQYYRKIFVHLQMPLPTILDEMNLSDQTNFYGIFLEALHNIEKHSQATEVKVSHRVTKDRILEFDIADNGIGFNEEKATSGIGITNMKQRISLLNGDLFIINTKKGTTIRIALQLKE